MKKIIILVTLMTGIVCIFLLIGAVDLSPGTSNYSDEVFEDYFRNSVRQEPYSLIDQIRIYECTRSRWYSVAQLEKRFGPPKIVTDLDIIEGLVDGLHFQGNLFSLNNSRGETDRFHVIVKMKTGERGYARIIQNKDIWFVKGNNTIYEIDEPSFLISLMDERASDVDSAP